MDPFTTLMMIITLIACLTTLVLGAKLSATQQELKRARRRMARLDELADGVATLEFTAIPEMAEAPEVIEVEGTASEEILRPLEETPVPERELTALDSGTFPAIGLEFNTGDVFDDEEEFAAPRMTSEVTEDPRVQKPSRKRHDTPVGSPRNLTPMEGLSVVEVGKIQVRSNSKD